MFYIPLTFLFICHLSSFRKPKNFILMFDRFLNIHISVNTDTVLPVLLCISKTWFDVIWRIHALGRNWLVFCVMEVISVLCLHVVFVKMSPVCLEWRHAPRPALTCLFTSTQLQNTTSFLSLSGLFLFYSTLLLFLQIASPFHFLFIHSLYSSSCLTSPPLPTWYLSPRLSNFCLQSSSCSTSQSTSNQIEFIIQSGTVFT